MQKALLTNAAMPSSYNSQDLVIPSSSKRTINVPTKLQYKQQISLSLHLSWWSCSIFYTYLSIHLTRGKEWQLFGTEDTHKGSLRPRFKVSHRIIPSISQGSAPQYFYLCSKILLDKNIQKILALDSAQFSYKSSTWEMKEALLT